MAKLLRWGCLGLIAVLAACAAPQQGAQQETELTASNPFNVDLAARGRQERKFDPLDPIESELAPEEEEPERDVLASAEQLAAAMPELRGSTYQAGLASWYGGRHHGTRTADGGRFDKRGMTAAHPTLPLGLQVKVLRLGTGKSVMVTITDRHPFLGKRIIDLSETAAKRLGFYGQGVTKVAVIVPEDRGDLAELLTRDSMNSTRWMLKEARSFTKKKKTPSSSKERSEKLSKEKPTKRADVGDKKLKKTRAS